MTGAQSPDRLVSSITDCIGSLYLAPQMSEVGLKVVFTGYVSQIDLVFIGRYLSSMNRILQQVTGA